MASRLRVTMAIAGAVSFCMVAPVRVDGQPIDVQVSPRVAPTGASVVVSGSGCTSQVRIVVSAFLFPGPPTTPLDTVVTPSPGGSWSTTFGMPAAPAYVVATCDEVPSSPPIVVAPDDVDTGAMSYSALTPTDVEITTSPLQNGSEFAVFDGDGHLLDSSIVQLGMGTVRVPRALGPVEVRAVGLRSSDPGIPLPYVPFSSTIQLPLAAAPTVAVAPQVTSAGSQVTASGTCLGTPRLVVTGRPIGWYDIPPVFVDADQATDAGGSWTTTFPMPAIPSRVTVHCTNRDVTANVEALISPSDGDIVHLVAEPSDIGATVVTIPKALHGPLEAFTTLGISVPLAVVNPATMTVQLFPTGNAGRIVIVGFEALGENAEALQNIRVQGWFVDGAVGPTPINGGIPIDGLLPAERIDLLRVSGNCCGAPEGRHPVR